MGLSDLPARGFPTSDKRWYDEAEAYDATLAGPLRRRDLVRRYGE